MGTQRAKTSVHKGLTRRLILKGPEPFLTRISWSPDGKFLAAGCFDHNVRIWDTHTGKLQNTFEGHQKLVGNVSWSPNGQILASASDDQTIRLWSVKTGNARTPLTGHQANVTSVAWSPDGKRLASGADDHTVRLWDIRSGLSRSMNHTHLREVLSVGWSPDGRTIASGSMDGTVRLWDPTKRSLKGTLGGHSGSVYCIAWRPGHYGMLASASQDRTIRVWNTETQETIVLENHTGCVLSVDFSGDGMLLASKSLDDTIMIWRCDTWQTLAVISEAGNWPYSAVSFYKSGPHLATLCDSDRDIAIWDLNRELLTKAPSQNPPGWYSNAKVVLLGETGVGKSGLALVLSGREFAPTHSSNALHVTTMKRAESTRAEGQTEIREILLWDLAGQAGYRLTHQLHLKEIAVALLLIDSRSETDPFASVRYWTRALIQAQRTDHTSRRMIKLVICARADRPGLAVSPRRLEELKQELGFDAFFETSALSGQGVEALVEVICDSINWELMPKVISSELFEQIKEFLREERRGHRVMSSIDDLYLAFLRRPDAPPDNGQLRSQFETCIERVDAAGIIRRLSFGNFVVLPELIDLYASAIVDAARHEPDGMGSILEGDVLALDSKIRIPQDALRPNREQEKILLIAIVEDLIRQEVVFREITSQGTLLIFPAQLCREHPDVTKANNASVVFDFYGPVENIYATLAVRIVYTGLFASRGLWRNTATYTGLCGGLCGVHVNDIHEGRGELKLFFDSFTQEDTKIDFEEFVHDHLLRKAIPESIRQQRSVRCPNCGTQVSDAQVRARIQRGFRSVECNVCEDGTRITFGNLEPQAPTGTENADRVTAMQNAADKYREEQAIKSVLHGKRATGNYDVFLSYNSRDRTEVEVIAKRLEEKGVLPWRDGIHMRPGYSWQRAIEDQIKNLRSAAVFFGEAPNGPWQTEEIEALLQEFVGRGKPVIPVILPGTKSAEIPLFLSIRSAIDFRQAEPDPIGRLLFGITGEIGKC